MDVMESEFELHALQIEHYSYGAWQSTWEVDPCITGILKLLGKYSPCRMLSCFEVERILLDGVAPDRWKSSRKFGRYHGPLHAPYICGAYCRDFHFVTFYICKEYWTLLDPLYEHSSLKDDMHENVFKALSEAYSSKGLSIPSIPKFRKVHKLATQMDHPYNAWSCGTFAILTIIHLHLGKKKPDEIPVNSISRKHMENLHSALLNWLLSGEKPDLWAIDCLNTSVVECSPIPLQHQDVLGGPYWASQLPFVDDNGQSNETDQSDKASQKSKSNKILVYCMNMNSQHFFMNKY